MALDWSKYKPLSVQTGLTIDSTLGGIALTVPTGARAAMVQVLSQSIRFWCDGTAPTSLTGFEAQDGDQIELGSYDEMVKWRGIAVSTSADAEVTYFH